MIHFAHRLHGFSLAELATALTIVALLAAVALPAWHEHRMRAWRIEARAELTAAMLALERHALSHATYASTAGGYTPAGQWPRPVPRPPSAPRHWLTATSCGQVDLAHCVELRATPVSADARCGVLVLRSNGDWLAIPPSGDVPVRIPHGC